MAGKVLEIQNLYSGYGKLKVLFDINISVEEGSITVVVGPNGAGKTTLLNTIAGLTTVYSGSIKFQGREIVGLSPHNIAKMGISYLLQMRNIASNLTVRDNLILGGYLLPDDLIEERMQEVINLFPQLKGFMDRKAGTLSGGERRMLAIAMTLMRSPKLLLLDEMSTDLAPILVKMMMNKIIELRDRLDLTILLVEQNAKQALEIGDYSYLLVSGEIRYEGDPKKLLKHPEFSQLYLGIKR
ncbi:MAG TPA: ABC transporter ATP-binding protein [Thermoprotei archaeon]|nr:ABC transporter ATP-binding protein [Thermoprotei archaeon]